MNDSTRPLRTVSDSLSVREIFLSARYGVLQRRGGIVSELKPINLLSWIAVLSARTRLWGPVDQLPTERFWVAPSRSSLCRPLVDYGWLRTAQVQASRHVHSV